MSSTEPIEQASCRGRTPAEQACLGDIDNARAEDSAKACVQIQARLAPHFGFAGSGAPVTAWEDLPRGHRLLLTATLRELLPLIEQPLRDELSATAIDRDRWRRIVELLARAAAGREGAEYVAELAEAHARAAALCERWESQPEHAPAAAELRAALRHHTT